jgi:hypothetical protein
LALPNQGRRLFAPNLVINLDGVVNKQCYESLAEKRNFQYVKEQKIEFVIGWPSAFHLIKHKSTGFQDVTLFRWVK